MCGIFGYIGTNNQAPHIILEGLKTLEYRGYDSWGIAAKATNNEQRTKNNGQKIILEKHTGKIGDAVLSSQFSVPSSLAIGHTRWATHGGVTVANAHPHVDCTGKIAVLQNGIIENFQELKDELLKKGHKFTSETDTEVIVHMLEEYMGGISNIEYQNSKQIQNTNNKNFKRFENSNLENSKIVSDFGFRASDLSFKDALLHVFNQLKGLNAIVAINAATNEIVAAKNGSPLIIGIKDNEYFLASDAAGILPHTKKIIFMKDNEMAVIKKNSNIEYRNSKQIQNTNNKNSKRFENSNLENSKIVSDFGFRASDLSFSLFSLPEGKPIEPEIETVSWNIEHAVKGKYKHFMLKEIYDQPLIIETISKSYTDKIKEIATIIKRARGTFFIGSGTAFHACLAGTYLFSSIAKRHVNTAPASEFNYLEDFLTNESLIIPLSQSGETIDVVEPLTRAKQKGSTILSLVNVLGSTIYRMGDYKLLLGAGPEKAVASTKAYIAKIAILTLLAYQLAGQQNEAKKILLQASEEVSRLLKKPSLKQIQNIAKILSNKEHIYIIGRGVSYATALEGALKIKEVSYIHTEGLAGGELKHGTIALISKGTPCIVLAPDDETYDAIISNATEIKSRGGIIIGISSKNSPVFDEWIEVKEVLKPGSAWCPALITQIVPMQLLAYYLAVIKNLDPDKPRNLAKSVTVK